MNPAPREYLPVVSEEDRENLSAFLDGELTEDGSEQVTAKLSRSHDLRATAEELKKIWELLDYLPRPQAPQNFTAQTLHRLDTTKMQLLTREKRWRWLAVAGWALSLCIAAGVGFYFAFSWPNPQHPVAATDMPDLSPFDTEPAKEPNGRLQPPPFPKNMDERVRRNINRILFELRDKATLNEWHKLRESARHGTWEFLEELKSLARKHHVPLELPSPKAKSPGEETRPRLPRNTSRRGGTD